MTFNRRHRRAGHLFQNRYKSIICEEDPYLLELIRYTHLNPLRAGLVKDLKELDKYPWTGHSTILGKGKNPLMPSHLSNNNRKGAGKSLAEKTVEDVLLLFGDNLSEARRMYRHFVRKGVDQGSRADLQGGGLVRSSGGNKAGLLGRKKEDRELADERILGSGDFVAEVLGAANELEENRIKERIPIDELADKVTSYFGIKIDDILLKSQRGKISEARSVICHMAINEMPAP